MEQWKSVMWSDESNFEVMWDKKTKTIRRPKGSNLYEKKYCKKTVKHPDKVMVWGCFFMRGRGGLWCLPKNVTIQGPLYTEVI